MRDNSKESYITDVSGSIIEINFNKNFIAMVPKTNVLNIFIGQELLIENPSDTFTSLTTI